MSDQNNQASRRNAIKMGVGLATLATAGVAGQAQAAEVKTPFAVNQIYIPIAGSSQEFPVRRIYCIGRNYAAHAR